MKIKTIFLILTTLGCSIACKKQYADIVEVEPTVAYKKVRIEKLSEKNGGTPIVATGILSSKEEITLSFKTGGIVRRLTVDEGQAIVKGQILASLDLSEINAQFVSAKNALDKADRDLERATNLYKDTVGTLEQKQNAQTAKEIAKADFEIASFNRNYSIVNAPVTGKVLIRYVEKGELVFPGQPIYRVAKLGSNGSQILRLGLSDKDITKVALEDNATVLFDAFEGKSFPAQIIEIAESSNSKTGLFEVELAFDSFYPELKNGLIGKVKIIPSKAEKTYDIPMDALVEGKDSQATVFFTTNGETVDKATVQVLDIRSDYFTVKSSTIPQNALIIKEGAPFLKPNDSIQILP